MSNIKGLSKGVELVSIEFNTAVKYVTRKGFVNDFPITFDYQYKAYLRVLVGFQQRDDYTILKVDGVDCVRFNKDLAEGVSVTIRRITPAGAVPHIYQYTSNAQGGAEFSAKTIDENFEYMSKIVSEVEDYSSIAQGNLDDIEQEFKFTQVQSKEALDTAEQAVNTSNEAKDIAIGIDGKAQEALDTANDAKDVAEDAKDTAYGIAGIAEEALDNSEEAKGIAQQALDATLGDFIEQGLGDSEVRAVSQKGVTLEINELNTKVKAADIKADKAQNTANTAVTNAKTADSKAVNAQSRADKAQNTANTADSKAVNAQARADSAYNLAANALTESDRTSELGTSTTLVATQKLVNDVAGQMFGAGQEWIDVTSQRSANTTYKNNTSKPIAVFIKGPDRSGTNLYVEDLRFNAAYGGDSSNTGTPVTVIVGVGASYRTSTAIIKWFEFR